MDGFCGSGGFARVQACDKKKEFTKRAGRGGSARGEHEGEGNDKGERERVRGLRKAKAKAV